MFLLVLQNVSIKTVCILLDVTSDGVGRCQNVCVCGGGGGGGHRHVIYVPSVKN